MLVTLWVGYGCSLMAVGVWRQALLPRVGACVLMCLGIGATGILLNHWWAEIGPENSNPIINFSFGAFAVCTIGLYLVAYLTARPDGKPSRFNQVVYPLALGLASVLTIGALSAEVITFLPGRESEESGPGDPVERLRLAPDAGRSLEGGSGGAVRRVWVDGCCRSVGPDHAES